MAPGSSNRPADGRMAPGSSDKPVDAGGGYVGVGGRPSGVGVGLQRVRRRAGGRDGDCGRAEVHGLPRNPGPRVRLDAAARHVLGNGVWSCMNCIYRCWAMTSLCWRACAVQGLHGSACRTHAAMYGWLPFGSRNKSNHILSLCTHHFRQPRPLPADAADVRFQTASTAPCSRPGLPCSILILMATPIVR
jgi:hypothetical protein